MIPETADRVSFALIIVGNEILDGRVRDSHFQAALSLLNTRNMDLAHARFLPDDPDLLVDELRRAISCKYPFFCIGGIGATPDDYTRKAAADACGVDLAPHPEGLKIIHAKFGGHPGHARLALVEFPKGSCIIPNPFNDIPGFYMGSGYFLPGFPEMAHPMMEWVLDTFYHQGSLLSRKMMIIPDGREGDLADYMGKFVVRYPGVVMSSLPRYTDTGIELRICLKGEACDVDAGLHDWLDMLDASGYSVDTVDW